MNISSLIILKDIEWVSDFWKLRIKNKNAHMRKKIQIN